MQRQGSAERNRLWWQHGLFYSWLLFASLGPLADERQAGRPLWLPLLLIAALATWYACWLVLREGAASPPPTVYLAGAGLLWVALVAVDASFLLLGLNVFAPYCLHHMRFGLTVVALFAGGWLWQRVEATGSVAWTEVAIAALIAVSGSTAVGYVSTLARIGAERKRLIDQLEAAQTARAAAERQAGVAAERQRLARDIHDTLTQGFASIVMLLEAAEESMDAADPARRHLAHALRSARDNLADSRRVVHALRPSELAGGDLPDALQSLAVRLSEETGVRAEAVCTGAPRPLDPPAQTAILRVAQEALSNVRRHAAASRVSITVSYMEDVVVLDVHDNGRGYDAKRSPSPDQQPAGVGLNTMRERVEELAGTLVVESAPGEGTTVAVTLPLPAAGNVRTRPITDGSVVNVRQA